MCRWLAYSAAPILLDELLYKREHSLIDQSLHFRMGVETTNGDGFGVSVYVVEGSPAGAPTRLAVLEAAPEVVVLAPALTEGERETGRDDVSVGETPICVTPNELGSGLRVSS